LSRFVAEAGQLLLPMVDGIQFGGELHVIAAVGAAASLLEGLEEVSTTGRWIGAPPVVHA
jgi:hypothetical protein